MRYPHLPLIEINSEQFEYNRVRIECQEKKRKFHGKADMKRIAGVFHYVDNLIFLRK